MWPGLGLWRIQQCRALGHGLRIVCSPSLRVSQQLISLCDTNSLLGCLSITRISVGMMALDQAAVGSATDQGVSCWADLQDVVGTHCLSLIKLRE